MGKGPLVRIEIIFLPLFGTATHATVHAAARHLQEHTRLHAEAVPGYPLGRI